MSKKMLLRAAILGLAIGFHGILSNAQGGSCKDPWINQAYNQLYHRSPSGTGLTGECNIILYGGGHWSNYNDLVAKVQAVKGAPSLSSLQRPITTTRPPVAIAPSSAATSNSRLAVVPENVNQSRVSGGKLISQDGGGLIGEDGSSMRSVQSVDKPRAPAGKYLVIPGGNLVDASGNTVRWAGAYKIVVTNGVSKIGVSGSTPVPGTVVTP